MREGGRDGRREGERERGREEEREGCRDGGMEGWREGRREREMERGREREIISPFYQLPDKCPQQPQNSQLREPWTELPPHLHKHKQNTSKTNINTNIVNRQQIT